MPKRRTPPTTDASPVTQRKRVKLPVFTAEWFLPPKDDLQPEQAEQAVGEITPRRVDIPNVRNRKLEVDDAFERSINRFQVTSTNEWWCNLLGCYTKLQDWPAWEEHVATHKVQLDGPCWPDGIFDLDDDRYNYPQWTYLRGVYLCPRPDCSFSHWILSKVCAHSKSHKVDYPPRYTHSTFEALRGSQRVYSREGWAASELPPANSFQPLQICWCGVCGEHLDFSPRTGGASHRAKPFTICDECCCGFHLDCLAKTDDAASAMEDDWLCAACSRNNITCAQCHKKCAPRCQRHRCSSYCCRAHYCSRCTKRLLDSWIFPTEKDRDTVRTGKDAIRRPFLCHLHSCRACVRDISDRNNCSASEALNRLAILEPYDAVVCNFCGDALCRDHADSLSLPFAGRPRGDNVVVQPCIQCHYRHNRALVGRLMFRTTVSSSVAGGIPRCDNQPARCDCQGKCEPDVCVNAFLKVECDSSNCNVLLNDSRVPAPVSDAMQSARIRACGNRTFLLHGLGHDSSTSKLKKRKGPNGLRVLTAREPIAAGSLLCEHLGEVVSLRELITRNAAYKAIGVVCQFFLELDNDAYIDNIVMYSLSRFIQHSPSPNSTFELWTVRREPRIGVFSIEDIPKGDTICADFSSCKRASLDTNPAP
ncbi:MAG: hypothetical protein KVP17_001219 [Porospora cf. gigantea B]|uniref:uncharacterized protein n=1 Tax=Porospora cf. gigantea B TaxID=2853592 RepID=UPI003571B48A|nr:MAG: hypothetical protein KVP17_001219 [Porospora cf. gigantea B]